MKKKLLSIFFILQIFFVWAQQSTGITGKIVDAKTQKPLQNIVVTLQSTTLSKVTNSTGIFLFEQIREGNQTLQIKSSGFISQRFILELMEGKISDLGIILLEEDSIIEQQLSLVTLTENDLGDENSGSESTAGLLQATRDAFNQAAAFNFGQARFRVRGLDNEYGVTMINGIIMNKMYDGRPQWSNWGGLNDATRNQEFTNGSKASDNTFGSILGTQEISTRASFYRPGTRISFSGTNSNYNGRMMGTFASGMDINGWTFVVSVSRRFAKEGYFDGTDYSANSFFATIEKKINDNHSLNFTSIYAQNSRGKNSPNTREVKNLADEKYNSYWGWQNGKKRNSRNKDIKEPVFLLSHYWKTGENSTLNTNVAYQFGSIGNSRLDFNGVNNPDPTYYRNLPSYYSTKHNEFGESTGNSPENIGLANQAKEYFLQNKQINWDAIYRANLEDPNKESLTILYEDRTDDKLFTASSIFTSQLTDHIILNAGATFQKLKSENFQNVLDLLGGTYYKDTEPFFQDDKSQNDLNHPNRIVVKGDRFGYNYILHAVTTNVFTQLKFNYNKFDFYGALNYSRSEYQREGRYKNGLYPTNSFGKSDRTDFNNYGIKGGITYKITGRHLLDFNGVYMTKAPSLKNTFPNARLNNDIVKDLKSESVISFDGSYIIRGSKLKARLTGYFSKIKDVTEISFFFAEGIGITTEEGELINANGNAFVAEIVKGLEKKNIGAELGIEYQITKTIKTTAVAAYGQYTYNSNPNLALNVDNIQSTIDFGKSAMKKYRQAGMPQQAYSLGLEYRDPKYWWIGANINYLADNYLAISPLLRTDNFFINPKDPQGLPFDDATKEKGRELLKQEKFNAITLVNLVGGTSWRVKGKTIGLFASINNLFTRTYKTGGFEQARNANFKELSEDLVGPNRSFGPKYFYGYGRIYFVNLYVNF